MKKSVVLLGLAVLLAATPVFAAEFLAPTKTDNGSISTQSTETHRNLYIAGANVSVNSPVGADLYAAGASININGDIEKNLAAAGSSMVVNGKVGANAHLAGANILVNNSVGGDLMVAGGNITIPQQSSIGGDLIVAGGNVVLDAPVTGNVRIYAGSAVINSKVGGKVFVQASSSLTFGTNAQVAAEIVYKGPKAAIVNDGAKISTIQFTQIAAKTGFNHTARGFLTIAWLIKLIALFIAAYLLSIFGKKAVSAVSEDIYKGFWANLGIGFLILIVGPILAIILGITVIGFYLAILTLLVYILMLMLSVLFGMIFIGSWLYKLIKKSASLETNWWIVLLGVVVVMVVSIIPFAGWLASLVITLVSFGALARNLKNAWKAKERA